MQKGLCNKGLLGVQKDVQGSNTATQSNAHLKPAENELNSPASSMEDDPLLAFTTQIPSPGVTA